jgi:hypothetical protein
MQSPAFRRAGSEGSRHDRPAEQSRHDAEKRDTRQRIGEPRRNHRRDSRRARQAGRPWNVSSVRRECGGQFRKHMVDISLRAALAFLLEAASEVRNHRCVASLASPWRPLARRFLARDQ